MTIKFKPPRVPRKLVGFVLTGAAIVILALHGVAAAPVYVALTGIYGAFAGTHAYSDVNGQQGTADRGEAD